MTRWPRAAPTRQGQAAASNFSIGYFLLTYKRGTPITAVLFWPLLLHLSLEGEVATGTVAGSKVNGLAEYVRIERPRIDGLRVHYEPIVDRQAGRAQWEPLFFVRTRHCRERAVSDEACRGRRAAAFQSFTNRRIP